MGDKLGVLILDEQTFEDLVKAVFIQAAASQYIGRVANRTNLHARIPAINEGYCQQVFCDFLVPRIQEHLRVEQIGVKRQAGFPFMLSLRQKQSVCSKPFNQSKNASGIQANTMCIVVREKPQPLAQPQLHVFPKGFLYGNRKPFKCRGVINQHANLLDGFSYIFTCYGHVFPFVLLNQYGTVFLVFFRAFDPVLRASGFFLPKRNNQIGLLYNQFISSGSRGFILFFQSRRIIMVLRPFSCLFLLYKETSRWRSLYAFCLGCCFICMYLMEL